MTEFSTTRALVEWRQNLTFSQFRQVRCVTLNCVSLWNHVTASEQDFISHVAPVSHTPAPTGSPRLQCLCVWLSTHRSLETESKEGRAMIGGSQSVKRRLKNDVMSVAVRPRPVGERRERLLEKICGGGEKKGLATLVNYVHGVLEQKHCQSELCL